MSDVKKINLEEIAKKAFPTDEESGFMWDQHHSHTQRLMLNAMKEACRQTLESASENAICIVNDDNMYTEGIVTADVDKQSILDIINQIK